MRKLKSTVLLVDCFRQSLHRAEKLAVRFIQMSLIVDYRKQFDEVLKSIAPSPTAKNERLEFLDRLLSFQSHTYNTKPLSLSPYVCARFGWKNVDKDMLECPTCGAALAIFVPPNLSMDAKDRVCEKYRRCLATAHDNKCNFRMIGEKYLCKDDAEPNAGQSPVVPRAFSSVFPSDGLMELEHPKPGQLIKKRLDNIKSQYPQKLLRATPLRFSTPAAKSGDDPKLRLNKAAKVLDTMDDFMTQVAITFWTAVDEKKENKNKNCLVLGCPLCWASFDVKDEAESSAHRDGFTQPLKRRRSEEKVYNLLDSHRYYCPVRCGFPGFGQPSGTPLWEVLLQKLEKEYATREASACQDDSPLAVDPTDVANTIRRTLLAGISQRKLVARKPDSL